MDTKTKILFGFLIGVTILSLCATFWKTVIQEDFEVVSEPEIEEDVTDSTLDIYVTE